MKLKNLTFEWLLSCWLRLHHIFHDGTVHLAVVDPGVGTQRRAILIQTKKDFFVGPDNGILVLAAQNQGIEHIYQLTNPKFMLPKISNTFHGRDIFAPAAAHLDRGVQPAEFGPEIKDPINPAFAKVKLNRWLSNRRSHPYRRLRQHNHKHKRERPDS